MSIHYETCARCDKDLVITMSDDYYFSDIDGKVLCKECYEKEQPKELAKQIADLEAKLAELKEKAIVLPKNLQVGNKVFWANEDGLFIGEIKTISQDTAVWFYVVYDNGLTYWHLLKDFNNEVFATKQEAQEKLKEIQGNG